MKSILIIHQSANLYGSDKTLLLLLSNIDRNELLPVVVLPEDGPLIAELEKRNIKTVIAPVLKLYRKLFTPVNLFRFLLDIKKATAVLDALNAEYKFQTIYSNTLAVLVGAIYARKKKIKHIWHVHEIIVHPKPIAAMYPHIINKCADVVVCNSVATEKNLIDRLPKLNKKTIVIHNGLDAPEKLNTAPLLSKQSVGFAPDDIVITLVGRISRLKGHKWLLKTYISQFSTTNIKLLFVGSPVEGQEYYLDDVVALIEEHNLQDNVKIVPFTKDLVPIWNITDIAVMPSTEAESFGLVALEAMLAKKPVIAANHGGLKEIVVDNKTGFLVEPEDEDELAKAIKLLAPNTALQNTMGNAGYERAITEFSLKKYVSAMQQLFK